jgi:Domain of unknown function (DUF5655)
MAEALDKINSDPISKDLWEKLSGDFKYLGSYEVEEKKTSLHIVNGRAFIGIHPRKGGLLVNLVTDKPIESSRIKKTEQVSANRFHNEILVTKTEDLDQELGNWMVQAYSLTKS